MKICFLNTWNSTTLFFFGVASVFSPKTQEDLNLQSHCGHQWCGSARLRCGQHLRLGHLSYVEPAAYPGIGRLTPQQARAWVATGGTTCDTWTLGYGKQVDGYGCGWKLGAIWIQPWYGSNFANISLEHHANHTSFFQIFSVNLLEPQPSKAASGCFKHCMASWINTSNATIVASTSFASTRKLLMAVMRPWNLIRSVKKGPRKASKWTAQEFTWV